MKSIVEVLANSEWGKLPLLTAAEEAALKRDGTEESRERLIAGNFKLISRVISEIAPTSDVEEREDLFQAGIIGLCEAVDRFDPDKGRLSTIALPNIRNRVSECKKDVRNGLSIPENLRKDLARQEKSRDILRSVLHREPSDQELELYMGTKIKELPTLVSIDADIEDNEGGQTPLVETIADKDEEHLKRDACVEHFEQYYSSLPDEDKPLFDAMFGLHGVEKKSILQLSKETGITRYFLNQKCDDWHDYVIQHILVV